MANQIARTRRVKGRNLLRWAGHRVGLTGALTQTTEAERVCLARHARGKKSLVEIGVMEGVNTGLLRGVMAEDGTITGIDPHRPGKLGVNFQRLIATRELGRSRRGKAVLLRKLSYEAAADWTAPIDFLFIDGDHSWNGVDRDWRDWSGFVVPHGIVALHDSRSVHWRPDLDSVRYTQEVVLADPRFRQIDAADSLTVLERVEGA